MAASQEQKVDFLLKKIGYVQSKTGIAEDASGISGTKKAPTEENKPSPLVVPSTSVWADSTFIPTSPPTSNTTYVGIYTATNAFRLTHDNTVTGNRTFIARSTFGNQTASISGDWIDPSFGADYAVQVYKGDPNSGGVSLSPTGSGNSDEWFFDYSSGILNFNGTNVPSGITTSNVYLIGYKYLGAKGVLPPAGRSNLTTLSVSGLSTFTGNVDANGDLDVDGHTELDNLNVSGVSTFVSSATFTGEAITFTGANYSAVWNKSDDELEFADNAKATFGDGADLKIYHDGSNNYIQGVSGNLILKNNTADYFVGNNSSGSVELNYNGSKKFETTGIGVSVSNGVGLTATIAGPSNLIIDPGVVGDNTGIVRIKGDLFVDGTQTQINSTTIELADFIVGVATTATSDLLSDGAGIQIGPNNTFLYEFNGGTNPSLKSSENLNVASGKVYQIDQTERLSADTLSLGTGTTIHSPASNVLTLGTNSAERLRITSAGDVGIGTDNPERKLDVRGTLGISDTTDTSVRTTITSSPTGLIVNHNDNSPTIFQNQGTERLRITSDGTIQLSNLTSTYTSGTATRFSLYNDTNNHYGLHVGGGFDLNYNAGGAVLGGKGEHVFHTAAQERVRITSDGNVGIGSVIPAGKLDVVGHTELDSVNVSGLSTFTGAIDANGNLDVDGTTELDVLNVSETATFSANIDANGDLDVDGHTELDNLNVSGVSTFASNVDINANLDVDGHTELDNLNVSGVTTTNTLEVTSTSQFKNNTKHFDGKYANFGNDSDLQIVHDGNNAVIQNATGQFFIDNNSSGGDIFLRANDNVIIRVDGNNNVLTAQNGGIYVTGHI